MICPNCNSEKTRKSGFNDNGSQRYYCNNCHKKFTPGFSPLPKVNKECPYCHSTNTKRGGSLASGAKRYICKDCKKGFSDNTIVREEVHEICPVCNSTNINRCGKNPSGSQRYFCKDCHKRFTKDIKIRPIKYWEVRCPVCHNRYSVKAGVTGNGNQYYKCTKCNHKFLENPVYVHTTEETKNLILKMYVEGKHKKDIAKELGISDKTIYKYTKGLTHTTAQDKVRAYIIKEVLNGRDLNDLAKEVNYKPNSIMSIMTPIYKMERVTGIRRNKVINYLLENKTIEETAKLCKCSIFAVKNIKKNYVTKFLKRKNKLNVLTALKEILNGKNIKQVCKVYNVQEKNMQKRLEKFYNQEELTDSQKSLIYKFGVQCRVPAGYLAPYVPCSIKKCNEFLSKYNIPEKQEYVLDERERTFDNIWLDSFVK